jgi:hypothetical protein
LLKGCEKIQVQAAPIDGGWMVSPKLDKRQQTLKIDNIKLWYIVEKTYLEYNSDGSDIWVAGHVAV